MGIKRRRKKPKAPPIESNGNTTQFLIQEVPIELKAKFKSRCASNKTSMKDATIEFMEEYTD